MSDEQVDAAVAKMREAGQSDAAIRQFTSALERVRNGVATLIPSSELEPAPDVPELDELPDVDPAMVLERLAVIKLNGGLATSMGLQQPKSLLEARDGRSFLRDHRRPDARAAPPVRRASAADPDEQRRHARADACRAGAIP